MKYLKYLLFIFILCLFSVNVNALEYTYDEFMETMKNDYSEINYFYLIGDRVFTSDHKLTLEDLMVGARSVNIEDNATESDIYDSMSTYLYSADYDDDWNFNGFIYIKNFTGKNKPDKSKKLNIKYIDGVKTTNIIVNVKNENELKDALSRDNVKTIVLGDDIILTSNLTIDKDITLKGNNKVIKKSNTVSPSEIINNYNLIINGNVTIDGIKIENALYGIKVNEGASVTLGNVEFNDNNLGGIYNLGTISLLYNNVLKMNNESIERPFIMTDSSNSVVKMNLQTNITEDYTYYYLGKYDIPVINYYTVKFVNDDNTVLDTQTVKEGNIPVYTKSIPSKDSDEEYNYKFYVWDQKFEPVTNDMIYKAIYSKEYKPRPLGTVRLLIDGELEESFYERINEDIDLGNYMKPLCKHDDCSYEFVGYDKDIVRLTRKDEVIDINMIFKKREKTYATVENYNELITALNGEAEQIIIMSDISIDAPIVIDRDVEILGYYQHFIVGNNNEYIIYINNEDKIINVKISNINLGDNNKGYYIGNNASLVLNDSSFEGVHYPITLAGSLSFGDDYYKYFEYKGVENYHYITIDNDYKDTATINSNKFEIVNIDGNVYYEPKDYAADNSKYFNVKLISNIHSTIVTSSEKNKYYNIYDRRYGGYILKGNYLDKEYKNKIGDKILVDKETTIYQLYEPRYYLNEYELYDREDRGTYDDERDLISLVVGKVKNYNNLLNRERTIYTYSVPAIDCRCGSADPDYVETEFDYYYDYDNKCRSKVLDVKVKGIGYISNGKVTEQYVDEFTTTDKSFKLTGNVKNKDGYYKVPGTFKYNVTITFNSQSFDYDTNEVEFYYDKNGNKEVFTATFDFVF